MADLQFIVDYSSLKKANDEILRTGSNAQKSAKVFEQAYKKVESAQKRSISQVRQQISFSERMKKQREKETNEAMKSLDAQRKANQQIVSSYQRIKAAADPLYASEMRLKEAQRSVITAYQQGNITRREAVETMRQYRAAVQNGTLAGQGLNKGMNRMGVLFQQTGYQVGDFAVQVQSGTHMMVALGQQATQLVGTFGMLAKSTKMIALFSGLGILVPIATAVAGAWMRASESMDKAADATSALSDAISSAQSAIDLHKMSIVELTEKYGLLGLAARESSVEIAKADFRSAVSGIRGEAIPALNELEEAFENLSYQGPAATSNTMRRLQEDFDEVANSMGLSRTSAERLIESFNDFQRAGNLNEKVVAALDLKQAMSEIPESVLQTDKSLNAAVKSINSLFMEGTELKKLMEDLEGSAPDSGWMNSAITGVNGLINRVIEGINKIRTLKGESEDRSFVERYEAGDFPGTPNFSGFRSAEYFNLLDKQSVAAGTSGGSSGGGGGGKSTTDVARENLQKLEEQLELEEALIGKSDERKRVIKALGIEFAQQNPQIVAGLEDQITKIDEMTHRENQIKKLGDTIKSSLGDAFMSIVDGSKSAGDAFKDMARLVLKQAFEMLVIQPILNGIFGSFGGGGGFLSALFSANGNAFTQGGKLTAYANGGVVTAPTAFQHSGGLGVMGEAGPEAIMPLKRGKNGKLGVQMEGSQQPVVINQSFNFQANGDDSVKRIIAQEAPRIANLTQKQIMDQRRRGGAMKSTFG